MSGLITALLGATSELGAIGKEEMAEKRKIDEDIRAIAREQAAEALRTYNNRQNIAYQDELATARQNAAHQQGMEEWDRRNAIQQGQIHSTVVDDDGNSWLRRNDGSLVPDVVEGGKGYADEANALEDPEFGLEAAYGKDKSILDLIQDREVPFRPRADKNSTPEHVKSMLGSLEKQIEKLSEAYNDAESDEQRKAIGGQIEALRAQMVMVGTGKNPFEGINLDGLKDYLGGGTDKPEEPEDTSLFGDAPMIKQPDIAPERLVQLRQLKKELYDKYGSARSTLWSLDFDNSLEAAKGGDRAAVESLRKQVGKMSLEQLNAALEAGVFND